MTLSKTKDIIAAAPSPRDQEMSNMISNMETKHGESKHGFGFWFGFQNSSLPFQKNPLNGFKTNFI